MTLDTMVNSVNSYYSKSNVCQVLNFFYFDGISRYLQYIKIIKLFALEYIKIYLNSNRMTRNVPHCQIDALKNSDSNQHFIFYALAIAAEIARKNPESG